MTTRRLLALFAVVGLALGPLPRPSAAEVPEAGPAASMELVSQTPIAATGQTFVATIRLEGVPEDGSIALDVYSRIRSRSELAQSMEGEGLRCCVFNTAVPLSAMPAQPDGTRRVVLSLDPAAGGLPLPVEGVYPLELTAQDAAGGALGLSRDAPHRSAGGR